MSVFAGGDRVLNAVASGVVECPLNDPLTDTQSPRLLASGQIVMRKVDGWETLAEPLAASSIDLAA